MLKNNLFKNRIIFGVFLVVCFLGGTSDALAACLVCKPYPNGAEFQYSGSYCPSGTAFVRNCVVTPPVPGGFGISPNPSPDGNFSISWNSVSGATRYPLYEVNGTSSTLIQNTSALSANIFKPSEGTYQYQVRACNASNTCSAMSAVKGVAVQYPPTIDLPASDSDGTFSLSWGNVGGSFRILEEKRSGGSWEEIYSGTGSSKTLTRQNNQWSYRIKGCTTYGDSSTGSTYTDCPTSTATKTITVNVPLPNVPTGMDAPTSDTDGAYSVSWNSVNNVGLITYTLEEKNLGTSGITTWSDLASNSKPISGNSNYSYQYKVKACSWFSGCSNFSATDTIDVAFKPGVPSFKDIVDYNTSSSVPVGFNAASGRVTSYDLNKNKIGESTWSSVADPTTVSNQTATGLTVGDWRFQIRAINNVGSYSNYGDFVTSETIQVRPGVPGSFSADDGAVANDGIVKLTWTKPNFATSYKIEQTLGGTTTTYSVGNVTSWESPVLSDGAYSFKIKGCEGSLCGYLSGAKTFTAIRKPNVPNVTSLSDGATSLDGVFLVKWPSQTWASSYTISQSGAASTTYTVNSTAQGELSKEITLTTSGTYAFKLKACNQSVCSGDGTSKSIDVVLKPGLPGFTSLPTTHTSASLSVGFSSASGEVVYYDLDKKFTSASSWSNISEPTSVTPQTASNLTVGDWHFQIRACNKVNTTSNCSNFVSSSTVQVRPGIPGSFSASDGSTANDGVVKLSWTVPSFATGYEIEQTLGSTTNTFTTGNVTTWDSSAFGDGTYSFKVKGCVGSTCGSLTSAKTFTVVRKPNAPAVSSISDGTTSNDGSFDVFWPAQTWADNYIIRQVGSESKNYTLFSSGSGLLSETISGLSSGTYEFSVSACNGNICSGYGSSKSITVTVLLPSENISGPTPPTIGSPSVSVSEQDAMDKVGAFSGQFRVGETGAVAYSVPLKLVEGTAGVTPQVSLEYSSTGNNGPMGKGWSIGGIDAISRCRQTLLQDGNAKPITWSVEDRFCFNGQRLLATSGTYGYPGSEYKTEIDSFIKVTAVGGSAGHPDYFEVKAKDGSVTRYGDSGVSNSERSAYAGGSKVSNHVASWSRSRFEDSVGNAIVYSYGQSEDYFYIEDIYYGAGSTPSSSNYAGRINFDYVDRTDIIRAWSAGYEFKNTKRLNQINIYSGTTKLRYYKMDYTHPSSYEAPNNLSRIDTITECITSSNCLAPLDFDWGEEGASWLPATGSEFSAFGEELLTYTIIDINGDGLKDSVWIENSGGSPLARYNIKGDNTLPTGGIYLGISDTNLELYPIDLNADGRMDFLIYAKGIDNWYYVLSVPDVNAEMGWKLTSANYLSSLPVINSKKAAAVGDFDSDGLTDIAIVSDADFMFSIYHLRLTGEQMPDGSAGFEFVNDNSLNYPLDTSVDGGGWDKIKEDPVLGDFNGDGRMDIAIAASRLNPNTPASTDREDKVLVYTRTNSGFVFYKSVISSLGTGSRYNLTDYEIKQIRAVDVNGDGLTDIAAYSDGLWRFVLNTGVDLILESIVSSDSSFGQDDLAEEKASFVDIDLDGNIEVVWRSSSNFNADANHPQLTKPILYKSWNAITQSFSENKVFDASTGSNSTLSFSLSDINGNGNIDRSYFYDNRLYTETRTYELDAINRITSGFGSVTEIKYEPLTTTENYATIKGIKGVREPAWGCQTYCYVFDTVTNAEDFYDETYEPFSGLNDPITNAAPVMEVRGPMYVVTSVENNIPTLTDANNKNTVQYFYETARVQSGGRGFLGFKKLTTLDVQNGVFTETAYRQDWPYIGQPIETVKRTSGGKVLSRDTSEHTIFNYGSLSFANLATTGTSALGPLQVYSNQSASTSYDLVSNGTVQGDPISTVVTLNTPDAYGNSDTMEIATKIGGSSVNNDGTFADEPDYSVADYFAKKKIENEYYNSEEGRFLGRLIRSTAIADRASSALAAGENTRSKKVSEFTYYGMESGCVAGQGGDLTGMLCDEIVKEDEDGGEVEEVQLTTRHHYDQFGNETWSYAWGEHGEKRLSGFVVYDTNGRYPLETYNVFNDQLSTTSVGDASYNSTADALGMSVLKTSAVISRDNYGTPTEVHSWVDENNYVVSKTYTTTGGNVYFGASSDGSYKVSLASSTDTANCPTDTAYVTYSQNATGSEGRTCFDLLGRKRRSLTLDFEGVWVAIDTEYDSQNRGYRTSEPFYVSGGPASLWSSVEYDLLSRPTVTTLPFDLTDEDGDATGTVATSTMTYSGLSVTSTTPGVGNGPDRVKTETKNVLGELISVTEYEVPTPAEYGYDVDGNLVRLTDTAGNATIMTYGVMGQKTGMVDLNKGTWSYQYSAFGDLLCQKDAVGNIIKQVYDGRGRMVVRNDYTGGTCASPSGRTSQAVWEYDVADNGLGQLSDEQDLDSGFGIVYTYDALGRIAQTETIIPGVDATDLSYHYSAQNYDQFGRVSQTFDAARNDATFDRGATQNVYNAYGYLDQIVDAHNAGDGGTVYYDVVSMDVRGNVVDVDLADGVTHTTNTFNAATGRLEGISTSSVTSTVNLTAIQDMTMGWDHLGNLRYRNDRGLNKDGTTRDFREDFQYDTQNRLTDFDVTDNNGTNALQNLYVTYYQDGTGNIKSKSDVVGGDYSYTNGRPHAVSSAGGKGYYYNANGSLTSDGTGRALSYTAFDKVAEITLNNRKTNFYYGTGRSRYKRVDTNLSPNPDEVVTTLYIGSVEKIYYADNKVEWKRSIGGVAQITYEFEENENAPNGLDYVDEKLVYFHKDHLGSINAITDSQGKILEEVMLFDPWGGRRKVTTYQAMNSNDIATAFFKEMKPETSRGFTGHEMVDEMNIIHMNGRIYDAHLGRMLQADSIVPDPTVMASLNRYSYVYNNPLNATDPSGHNPFLIGMVWGAVFGAVGKAMDMPWLSAIGGILMCASGSMCDVSQFANVVGSSAGFAFGSTYAATGDLGASIKSAGAAAFSSAAFMSIGKSFGSAASKFPKDGAMHVFSHAMVGGISSVLQGGKFGSGFLSAGFVKAITPDIGRLNGWKAGGKSYERAFAAAIVGGTVSAATGGKFGNGALTAAMGNLLNDQGGNNDDNNDGLTLNDNIKGMGKRAVQLSMLGTIDDELALVDSVTMDNEKLPGVAACCYPGFNDPGNPYDYLSLGLIHENLVQVRMSLSAELAKTTIENLPKDILKSAGPSAAKGKAAVEVGKAIGKGVAKSFFQDVVKGSVINTSVTCSSDGSCSYWVRGDLWIKN